MFYDLDAAFGGDCSGIYPSHNSLSRATDPSFNKYTRPLRSLLANNQFKIDFINRYADLLNSNFLPSQLIMAINKTTGFLIQKCNSMLNDGDIHLQQQHY